MLDLLFRKLTHYTDLTRADRERIEASAWRVDHLPAHTDLVREGDHPRLVNVVLDGWACRYKQLEDGRRQVCALLIPGDMCDPCVFLLNHMSHALATLTPSTVVRIPEGEMLALLDRNPAVMKALWLDMLVTADVQREWTVSLGRRTAIERMAHLFCEVLVRMRMIGRASRGVCDLPMTQADLGDALGLSAVHVNRTLQELRGMRLVDLRGRQLVVLDELSLQSLALFNPSYLHLQRPGS